MFPGDWHTAAAIVVCIAALVLNKMLMITTVRVGPDSVGW